MKYVYLCLTLALVPSNAQAAPFGITEGQSIKSLKVQERFGEKSFVISPPRPNSNFSEYVAIATPLHGVCAVIGRTNSFSTFRDAYAKQSVLTKLLSKYGKSTAVRPGERAPLVYTTPNDLPRQWKGQLPYGLDSITIETVGENKRFVVELAYFYNNITKCQNWVPKGDKEGL